jgi:hypothetical protein
MVKSLIVKVIKIGIPIIIVLLCLLQCSKKSKTGMQKIMEFEPKEVRLQYFKENEDSFNYFKDIIIKFDITQISFNAGKVYCDEDEYIDIGNIPICTKNSIKDINEQEFLRYAESFKDISSIKNRTSDGNISVQFIIENAYDLLVDYTYYHDSNEVGEDERNDILDTLYIKNVINENWATTYTDFKTHMR